MSIYAISDLHLSISKPEKSMQEFGDEWKDYEKRIEKNWKETVGTNDTVIIPGDISWAMTLDEAKPDFAFIESLPGKKIIVKGNHDYYFSTLTKVQKFLKDNNFNSIEILYNNSYNVEGYNICGTRGWKYGTDTDADDDKVIDREVGRLKLSIDSIKEENKNLPIIVAIHYPPFNYKIKKVLEEYNVKKCIYGHLHGEGHYMVKQGIDNNVEYIMVGGDYTGFRLIKLN
jgi:predicted phosphohydrolase